MSRSKKTGKDRNLILSIHRAKRRVWQINPATRVVPSKRLYVRSRAKREAAKVRMEEMRLK